MRWESPEHTPSPPASEIEPDALPRVYDELCQRFGVLGMRFDALAEQLVAKEARIDELRDRLFAANKRAAEVEALGEPMSYAPGARILGAGVVLVCLVEEGWWNFAPKASYVAGLAAAGVGLFVLFFCAFHNTDRRMSGRN